MKKLLFFFVLFSLALPTLCYAQLTVQQGDKKRSIDARYIMAIESKSLILHQPYKQKYNKREQYRGIPTFAFTDCKNIGVFADNLHILLQYYDSSAEINKDTMLIIPLADISAIVATKNEALYGKSGVMHIIALPLLSVGLFVAGVYNLGIGSPENAFPALGASAVSGLLFWWSVKSLQNEKKYTISTKKWKLHSN